MKKVTTVFLSIVLCMALILSLSSCGKKEEKKEAAKTSKYKVGDTLKFGHYEQDNDASNGKEPIEWVVIGINNDGNYVLMSKYALDAKPYNTKDASVTWETCTLRKWLNEDFYDAAFSSEEKAKIKTVRLVNEDNPVYSTKGGNDTEDKVWLLSINELTNEYRSDMAYSYFKYSTLRMCEPTKYALAMGSYWGSDYTDDGVGTCYWWLRSSGNDSGYAAYGGHDFGFISRYGIDVSYDNISVRPVIVIQP